MACRQFIWVALLVCTRVVWGGSRTDADLRKITIEPSAAFISGPGGTHTFVVTAYYEDGHVADLSRDAVLTISDPNVAKIGTPGTIISTAEGVTRIGVKRGKQSAEAALIVTQAKPKSWQFESDIAPIFSKLGCNNNACHGALNGQ